MIKLKDEALTVALCKALEPSPPVISATDARIATKGFAWSSCYAYHSPEGWWQAEIGTDHGPDEMDHAPIRWKPLRGLLDDISVAWRVVTEMKSRGWLFHILAMTDGWVVNGIAHDISNGWPEAMMQRGVVQEIGEEVEEAICRAALSALTGK